DRTDAAAGYVGLLEHARHGVDIGLDIRRRRHARRLGAAAGVDVAPRRPHDLVATGKGQDARAVYGHVIAREDIDVAITQRHQTIARRRFLAQRRYLQATARG